ncbi:MAG: Fic family protein [Glaciecola sp.]|jgi:Fic family protein
MKAPHSITPKILNLVQDISHYLGKINASSLQKVQPELRKKNKIKTIHSTLAIEGNTLTEDEVTRLIDNKRVKGPKNEIIEVLNAVEVYNQLPDFNPYSEPSFKKAHKLLMSNLLLKDGGKYRSQGVGVGKHIAPPYGMVPELMKTLFKDLKESKLPEIVKSCIFHYEHLFIHPYIDGNGRMGRLWQTLILVNFDPIFEFIPIENFIKNSQSKYYTALRESDVKGSSTMFIEFMLSVISDGLIEFINQKRKPLTKLDRLKIAKKYFKNNEFSRKEYLKLFLDVSAPTATRDLRNGVENKLLKRTGKDRNTKYLFVL